MTKKELVTALDHFDDDDMVVIMDEKKGWDNIQDVNRKGNIISIVFGGGSPFSDE